MVADKLTLRRLAARLSNITRWLLPVALCALAAWGLHHILASVNFTQVKRALVQLPPWRLGAAVVLSAISYLALTLYDVLAL
ncbi:MAG: hypothetical protein RLZZ08_1244, partial [Pseudomonadota bacterium]